MAMDFDSLWGVIVSRLLDDYRNTAGDAAIFPASKKSAIRYLDDLKRRVETMEDFKAFPEGDPGVIFFALRWYRLGEVSDGVEFGLNCEGLANLIDTFRQAAVDENPWHTLPPGW